MSIEKSDPRLSAYALGEMDEQDRAVFERELDDGARAEIHAIRALAGDLGAILREEPGVALTEAQRHAVTKAAGSRASNGRALTWLSVAALLAVTVIGYALATQDPEIVDARAAPDGTWEIQARSRADVEEEEAAVGLGAGEGVPAPGAPTPYGTFAGPNGGVDPTREGRLAVELEKTAREYQADATVKSSVIDTQKGVVPSADPKDATIGALAERRTAGVPPGVRLPNDPAPPAGPGATVEVPAVEEVVFLPKDANGKPADPRIRRWMDLAEEAGNGKPQFDADIPAVRARLVELIRQKQPFTRADKVDVSTFSIDVDTASYAQVRRMLLSNQIPPAHLIRVEEMVNYFRYDYAPPEDGPFAAHVEMADCPWNGKHKLARIAIKGREIDRRERPQSNLVFLVDVSGSMSDQDKLPLLQKGLGLLVDQLDERDRVSIVVYAGAAGCALEPTDGAKHEVIRAAIGALRAGGSTNGGEGIQLAYALAAKHFKKGGINRVILCTDGDFNVGITRRAELLALIAKQAESGVYLSVLGFGTGNYKDASMEELSNRGNGNYAYIDSIKEAQKTLVEEMSGTLQTIAKDVKIQVFFNPEHVAGWRLIGYENRVMAAEDFNDDKKDAGDIGAGHTVTALYELVPTGARVPDAGRDPNPFLREEKKGPAVKNDAWFQLRLRYKLPDSDESTLLERFVKPSGASFDGASPDFRFAAGVAAFGLKLGGAAHLEGIELAAVEEICGSALGEDPGGYRKEFVGLVKKARELGR